MEQVSFAFEHLIEGSLAYTGGVSNVRHCRLEIAAANKGTQARIYGYIPSGLSGRATVVSACCHRASSKAFPVHVPQQHGRSLIFIFTFSMYVKYKLHQLGFSCLKNYERFYEVETKTLKRRLVASALISPLFFTVAAAQDQPVPQVGVVKVEQQDFTLTARLPGRIKPSTISEIRPQVSGIIRERLFEEGARLKRVRYSTRSMTRRILLR